MIYMDRKEGKERGKRGRGEREGRKRKREGKRERERGEWVEE